MKGRMFDQVVQAKCNQTGKERVYAQGEGRREAGTEVAVDIEVLPDLPTVGQIQF